MGFIRGITLEGHPRRLAKPLLTGAARGSVGIPDSLVHKPVDTSGRTAWPVPVPLRRGHLPCRSQLRGTSLLSFVCFISYSPFLLAPWVWCRPFRPQWPACGDQVADLRKRATVAGICDRTDDFLFADNDGGYPSEKGLENGRPFLLRTARRRVIIELSPGNRKTSRIPHPARAMSGERNPGNGRKPSQNARPSVPQL